MKIGGNQPCLCGRGKKFKRCHGRLGQAPPLEDETNPNAKHCEFAAVSKATGKKYWIEAKMRAAVGLLGRTAADGTTSPNPISHMVRHLNGALGKPGADERMIFIDVNTEMPFDVSDENRPPFVAVSRNVKAPSQIPQLCRFLPIAATAAFSPFLPVHKADLERVLWVETGCDWLLSWRAARKDA